MSPKRKSEGWKIPLLFCGGVLLITGTVSLLKNKTPEIALPPALVEKARNSGIDMKTPANRPWQDKILAAASGFAARDDKDRKLLALAESALAEKNFEAACAAFSQISTAAARQVAEELIFRKSLENCDTLVWGVYAAVRSVDAVRGNEQFRELEQRWNGCPQNGF